MKANRLLSVGMAMLIAAMVSGCASAPKQGMSMSPQSNRVGTSYTSERPRVTAIPAELQAQADALFATGKCLFIWDLEEGKPLQMQGNFPCELRQIGYAFAPTSSVTRFDFSAKVTRRVGYSETFTLINLVKPGPDNPSRIGMARVLVAAVSDEEMNRAIKPGPRLSRQKLVTGEGRAVISVVPIGTGNREVQSTVLSNEITIPIEIL